MARVIDANLVIKWYVEEPDSRTARELLWETEEFAVPDLLFLETGSILSKKVRNHELTSEEARRISELIVTNTLPLPPEKRLDKITVLSIAPLLARAIREVFDDGSVTTLFGGLS